MTPADTLLCAAATTSLTRLMTHDTITEPWRSQILARGAERTVLNAPDYVPVGGRWESLVDTEDRLVGWHRSPAWYVRMLACPRFCAPMWAAAAVAVLWRCGAPGRTVVTALGLRGIHATAFRWTADQFGGS